MSDNNLSNFGYMSPSEFIKTKKEFREVKQNFIAVLEIYKQKRDSGNQVEADEWLQKGNVHWLKLTEILAKDWGYDLDTFRELWKIKNPNIYEVTLKREAPLAILDGSNFFDFFGTSSSKQNINEPKSLWQTILDFFS